MDQSISTRVDRNKQLAPRVLGYPERVALFIGALHKDRAAELLGGLSSQPQARAIRFARDMREWESARRQARLAHEFGLKPDAHERLHELVVSTPGALRQAVASWLPQELRREYPHLARGEPSEASRALAARLVREASR